MNERKAVLALLTVIAVLLALNLVANGTGETEAQVREADGEPYLVKWLPRSQTSYYRVWSDGQVDWWSRPQEAECDSVYVDAIVPAAGHPLEVVEADSSSSGITIQYADGRVDFVDANTAIRCTLFGDGSDPFCIGDTDRSGVTDFQDIINVLEDWGECSE